MGLEAINFFFRSEEQVKSILDDNKDIVAIGNGNYVYRREGEYWIDISLQDPYLLSLRITLSNPSKTVLWALHNLLLVLFRLKDLY